MARSRNTGVKTRRKQRGGNRNYNTDDYEEYNVNIYNNNYEYLGSKMVNLYPETEDDDLLYDIMEYIIDLGYLSEGADEDCIQFEHNDDLGGRGFDIVITCIPENSNSNQLAFEDSLYNASRYPQPRVFPPPGNDPNVPERGPPNTNATDPNPNEQSGGRRKAKRTKAKRTRRTKKHSRRKTKKATRRHRRL
jgi:hypothetical protein